MTLGFITLIPADDGFVEATLPSVTVTNVDAVGESLWLRFEKSTTQINEYLSIDDVTLTVTTSSASPAAPEPSSLILASMGLVGLAVRRRRHNR